MDASPAMTGRRTSLMYRSIDCRDAGRLRHLHVGERTDGYRWATDWSSERVLRAWPLMQRLPNDYWMRLGCCGRTATATGWAR